MLALVYTFQVVLETEITNKGALRLCVCLLQLHVCLMCDVLLLCRYERLGFSREKRLCKYYLNGVDAFRLTLWFVPPHLGEAEVPSPSDEEEEEMPDLVKSDLAKGRSGSSEHPIAIES